MSGLSQQSSLLFKRFPLFFRVWIIPVLSVSLALLTNWLVAPHLYVLPPFLTFIAAVMATAWYGGFRSAMLTIVLSAFAVDYFFILPIHSFALKPGEVGAISFFGLEAIAIAYCIDYLRRNEERLRQANMELENRVAINQQLLRDKEEKLRGLRSLLVTSEERERRQLAAELHDYLAQLLVLARMKVKQAQQALSSSVRQSNKFICETDELLTKSVEYVRTLLSELYPVKINELGLPDALRELAGQMSRHGLHVELVIEAPDLPLVGDQATILYQSVRELLINILKHAAVDRAVVSLEVDSNDLLITVRDNGRGFDTSLRPSPENGKHFGLSSIVERMATMGGTFSVETAIGWGTTVKLSVPLETFSESTSVRAANSTRQDRVKVKPPTPTDQESLPL